MARKGHEDERACSCDQADGSCAGWAVRRLSQGRIRDLAEEIWTASNGGRVLPAGPSPDPRGSRPGASAQAAYEHRRQQEHGAWRLGSRWRTWTAVGAAVTFLLISGFSLGFSLSFSIALLIGLLTRWLLRFRPSAGATAWRRQAELQRRTAGLLQPLEAEGYLVLHDVALPGWPASVGHLVIGASGVWVVESRSGRGAPPGNGTPKHRIARWRASGDAAGWLRVPRAEAAALADALAAAGVKVPVRPLLCVYGVAWPSGRWPLDWSASGVVTLSPRQLADHIRTGPPLPPRKVDQAAASAVEVLRPAI